MTRKELLHGAGVLLRVGCWFGIAALAMCALARIFSYDHHRVFTLINANTFWLYLPAYVVAFGALWFQRWLLAACAIVIVVLHMVWVFPGFTRGRAVPASAAHAPHLHLITQNLRFDNGHKDELARQLRSFDADVLLLQEVTPRWWDVLEANGVLAKYPARLRQLDQHANGLALLSRRPLLAKHIWDAGGAPMLSAIIETDRGALRLVDVHPQPPAFVFNDYRRMTSAITDILRDDLLASGVPTLVAGDFNSTPYNKWIHDILGLGLHSAHEDRGRPLATSWPNGLHKFPPLRLDHVMMTGTLVTLSVREGDGVGSDHRPVIADIAVLG
jgi:endonuclease/exonuclease/phosphatase (EEP) superfamily protein YafD